MELEIQKYLMSKFSGLSFNFFDGTECTEFPYGRFGYTQVIEVPNKSNYGQEMLLQIDLFSDYNGQSEIKRMIAEVRSLIRASFSAQETIIHQVAISTQILEEKLDDKHIYHGVVELTLAHY